MTFVSDEIESQPAPQRAATGDAIADADDTRLSAWQLQR